MRQLHKLNLSLKGETEALVTHSRDFYYSDATGAVVRAGCNTQTFEDLQIWWRDVMSHNFQKSLPGFDQMNYVSSF